MCGASRRVAVLDGKVFVTSEAAVKYAVGAFDGVIGV